jgi:hypothetical protein
MAIRDPERYFDRRTYKRHLKRGHASESDYSAYLQSLPDMSDNLKQPQDGGDDDGFEARAQAKARRGQIVQASSVETLPLPQAPAYPPLKRAPIETFDDDDDDDDDL